MNRNEFIFEISQQVTKAFESPVILLTRKDYAECIFKSLVDMRKALLKDANPKHLADIVYSFHLEWLEAVKDIETYKKKFNTMPRNYILDSIDYTLKCVNDEYFQRYIDDLRSTITVEEKNILKVDVELVKDMRQTVIHALIQKQKDLASQADQAEFYVMVMNEIDELLNWLDKLNDCLAIAFCKVLEIKFPLHPCELNKTLQSKVEEVTKLPNPEAGTVANKIMQECQKLGRAIRISSLNDFEICKVLEKIKQLENRIHRLKMQKSLAVTALEHKTMYLEERLRSLENLKLSLRCLHSWAADSCNTDRYHIFNHLLPPKKRCQLVDSLMKLWNKALKMNLDEDSNSIISILSVADLREVYSDAAGQFFIDKFGRKIYHVGENGNLYQLNEHNELVPLKDDEKHLYFYDECGRYYFSSSHERVYKAHHDASEYVMDRSGRLVMYSQLSDDGIVYHYNNLGRYYTDEFGTDIYREKGDTERYLSDGLGNLVRIRDEESYGKICPLEPMVMEENFYLKGAIGDALKKCLAQVIVAKPQDPIKYLADCLEKYQKNIIDGQKRFQDTKSLFLTRAEMNFDNSLAVEPLQEEQQIESDFSSEYKSEMSTNLEYKYD